MIRLLAFLVLLLALAFGFAWLADRPGEVTFVWQGTRVDTDLMTVAIGVVAFVVAVMVVVAVLRAIWNTPGSIGSFFGRRRRDKGWAALSRGMIAVGAGDPATAAKFSTEARRILGDEPLALLLEAQSAQSIGDRAGARAAFEAMAKVPATRLLGLRGLYVEAVRWGDGLAAAAHAEAANQAAPKLGWAGQALVEYRSQSRDWQGALETIERNRRHGVIDKADARRLRAVVLTADALEREQAAPDVVRATALEAHGLAPGLVPAACVAARLVARGGDLRKAARVLEAAWKVEPHPELAEAYAHLRAGDSVQDRLSRIRDLVKVRAHHPECALAMARAEIDVRDFAGARRSLEPFVAQGPSRRVCLLMAEIEEGEHGNVGAARAWLTRAVHAARDRTWVADGFVSDRWMPVSPVSGRLDAFEWKLPPEEVTGLVTDPIDRPDEALALSGSITPIEAPPAPEVAPVVEAAVAPEPAKPVAVAPEPAKAPVTAPPQAAARPITVAPERDLPDTAVPPTIGPTGRSNGVETALPHLPDDPGPDTEVPAVDPKKRFRLFN
ncbi:heme biosynthesis protein HemY [Siculibacillus lacustris]|uniref:Heme biosynthesis protein HemY n=1 Tax=Siculibacillus lacustris TaxID=1549641 RepID=A0A4Q9VLF3_9HYPH|nr:heme biosynthesis HemY N-terminal domain-containing protein [Siculibacillus lacustris]TBW36320.1 heme biosynthesis protein HemY [Siculibacillus lacustris]